VLVFFIFGSFKHYDEIKSFYKIYKMVTFNIIVWSKSKASLNYFILFFKRYVIYNSNTINKHFQKKINTKTITILGSPHVNKNSQEQFEIKTFKKHFKITVQENSKLLLFLKKLNYNIGSDINIKIKQSLNSKFFFKKKFNLINSNNLKVGIYNITIEAKNFKFKKELHSFKKNIRLNFIISKKINQLFFAYQLYS